MRKIYLLLTMAFLGGELVAQSTTTTSQSSVNQSNTTTQEKVSTNHSATLSGHTTYQDNVLNTATKVEDLPGYPVLQNTGDANLDKQNFEGAKEKWMKDNQALYDEFIKRNNSKMNSQKEEPNKVK